MQLNDLYPAILTIILVGVLLGVGLVILGTLQTNTAITSLAGGASTNNTAFNAINLTIVGLGTFATWIGIIVLVIAAAIVINLVVKSFRNN